MVRTRNSFISLSLWMFVYLSPDIHKGKILQKKMINCIYTPRTIDTGALITPQLFY